VYVRVVRILTLSLSADSLVTEQCGYASETFTRPKDEAELTPLGPPLTNATPKPPGRTYRGTTLRRSLGLVLGAGLLWLVNSHAPIQHHIALLSHTNQAIAQTWQLLAPPPALDQYRAHVKRKELDRWIEEERVFAWARITNNIGPAAGAGDGIVIASPSAGQHLTEPDYYVSTLV